MNLNELITSAKEKLQNKDLTEMSRQREWAILQCANSSVYLTAAKDELRTKNKRLADFACKLAVENNRLKAEIAVKDMAVAELRLNVKEMDSYIGRTWKREGETE